MLRRRPRAKSGAVSVRGAVAQLGERCNRTAEATGSIPVSSMKISTTMLSDSRGHQRGCFAFSVGAGFEPVVDCGGFFGSVGGGTLSLGTAAEQNAVIWGAT
jgi:hypothetical protein